MTAFLYCPFCFFHPQQAPQQFLKSYPHLHSWGPVTSVTLPGLNCSFPLTLITGYNSTKIGSPAFHPKGSAEKQYRFPLIAQGHRNPKWPGASLSFQFSGMFVASPGRSTPLSGTKTRTGSKTWSLGARVEPFPFLPLNSWSHGSWLWEKLYVPANVKRRLRFM